MSGFLLDTNILSELRKQDRCDPGVRAWFEQCPEGQLYVSVLVLGLIRRGIERIRARDPRQADA
ncbi:MAG: type II toxin-antitoxin system VapC family toxin, partial [Verrucomicrobiota bacterium]